MRCIAASLGSLAPMLVDIGKRRIDGQDEVLLTFDDGPHPRTTPMLLDILALHSAHAVFFLNGEHIVRYAAEARAIVDAGHVVANHGYRHTRWSGLSAHEIRESIEATEALLNDLDSGRPHLVRAPYGRFPRRARVITRTLGLHPVAWNCMPYDFVERRSVPEMRTFLRRHIKGGAIVVLHENDRTHSRLDALTAAFFEILHLKHLRTAEPRAIWQ